MINIDKQFFQHHGNSFWSFCIEYELVSNAGITKSHSVSLSKKAEKSKVDYKINTDFSESDKLLFLRLREWRKEKAGKEGIPVYVIASNTELEKVVIEKPLTLEALKNINGFGIKKIERHGKEILNVVAGFLG